MRMSEETKEALDINIAVYGKPWIVGLLAKIGEGKLVIVPAS